MVVYLNKRHLMTGIDIREVAAICKAEEWHHIQGKTRLFFRKYYSIFEIYKHRKVLRETLKFRLINASSARQENLVKEGYFKLCIQKKATEFRARVKRGEGTHVHIHNIDSRKKYTYSIDDVNTRLFVRDEETKEWRKF